MFCLTPRLSLQLYYIPVLTPEVAGAGAGAGRGEGRGVAGAGVWARGWAGTRAAWPPLAQELGPPCLGMWS